jgi:hypothetical protein
MLRRVIGLFLSFALTVAGVIVTSAPAEAAGCTTGSSYFAVGGSRSYKITHVKGYQAPPGGSYTITKSASFQRQLSSSLTTSAGVKVTAGTDIKAVLATAEAQFSVDLAVAGAVTSTYSESVSATLAASSRDRYYAAYAGRRYWVGWYSKYTCYYGSYEKVGEGKWRSFQSALEGVALCPASRYTTNSLPYKACMLTWS